MQRFNNLCISFVFLSSSPPPLPLLLYVCRAFSAVRLYKAKSGYFDRQLVHKFSSRTYHVNDLDPIVAVGIQLRLTKRNARLLGYTVGTGQGRSDVGI